MYRKLTNLQSPRELRHLEFQGGNLNKPLKTIATPLNFLKDPYHFAKSLFQN